MIAFAASEVPARRGEGAKERRYGAEELGAAAQGFAEGGVGLQLGTVSAARLTRARPNSRPLLAPHQGHLTTEGHLTSTTRAIQG